MMISCSDNYNIDNFNHDMMEIGTDFTINV